MSYEFTIGRVKRPFRPDCPRCAHGWDAHEARLPRQMSCTTCLCQVTVKWRHAWVVWLLRVGNALVGWAQG